MREPTTVSFEHDGHGYLISFTLTRDADGIERLTATLEMGRGWSEDLGQVAGIDDAFWVAQTYLP